MNINETAAVLILIGVNIATLLLFIQHRRLERMQIPFKKNNVEQDNLSCPNCEAMERFDRIEKKLDLILQRIGQLKTREADEESDDQKAKAQKRYEDHKVGA
ncbi:MAG: hypothetical protein ACR2OU_05635 [Thermomicrobiales bacterium]